MTSLHTRASALLRAMRFASSPEDKERLLADAASYVSSYVTKAANVLTESMKGGYWNAMHEHALGKQAGAEIVQAMATLSLAQNKLKKLGQGGSFSRQSENFRSVPQLAIDELLEAKARTQKALKLVVGEPSGAGQAVPALNQAVKSLNDAGNILYKLAGT